MATKDSPMDMLEPPSAPVEPQPWPTPAPPAGGSSVFPMTPVEPVRTATIYSVGGGAEDSFVRVNIERVDGNWGVGARHESRD